MHIEVRRLWPRRPRDGSLPLGLSCDSEGLLLAGNCRLIAAALTPDGQVFFRARPPDEINAVLSAGYGAAVDISDGYPKIERLAGYMSRGEWTRAVLAALNLRLPELPDQAAARRVLEADWLLKLAWNSDLHPRWPAHSQEGRGGEFSSTDGGDNPSLAPAADDPTENIQVHFHHWHDQAITKRYAAEGLLTPEAQDYLLNNPQSKSPPIYQDIRNPDMRVHLYDAAHRAATAEVKEISQEFIQEKGITSQTPMTRAQAVELIARIRMSPTPALTAYRSALLEYISQRWNIARMQFSRLPTIDPR